MPLFSLKIEYALRALLDLAERSQARPVQCREIATRQEIPEAYLNQLLAVLRRAGLVRSLRGSSGGYVLNREAASVTVADVLQAFHGPDWCGAVLSEDPAGASPIVESLRRRTGHILQREMESTSLADLLAASQGSNDARSLMIGL